jgi:hypothetical protein
MGLLLVEPCPDDVSGLVDVAARGARTQQLLAELEIDDVVRTERLDDVSLDRNVAVGRDACDLHAFGPDTDREIVFDVPVLDDFVVQLVREAQRRSSRS